jgi:hypothetical protein
MLLLVAVLIVIITVVHLKVSPPPPVSATDQAFMPLQEALFGIACRMVGDVHKFYVDSENYAHVAVF